MADNESDDNVSIFSLCHSFEMFLPWCIFFFFLKKKKYVVSNNKDFRVIQPKEFLEAVSQFGGPESSDEGGARPLQTQHCQWFYFCVLPIKIGSDSEICTAKRHSSKTQPAFGTATCWRYLTKDKGRLYIWGLLCTACKHRSLTWLPVHSPSFHSPALQTALFIVERKQVRRHWSACL